MRAHRSISLLVGNCRKSNKKKNRRCGVLTVRNVTPGPDPSGLILYNIQDGRSDLSNVLGCICFEKIKPLSLVHRSLTLL